MDALRPTETKGTGERLCVIGAGPAGLITAHTLIQDGFTNVQVLTRDSGPGGGWDPSRIYPGLLINNVYGEYRFSPMEMPAPTDPTGRLSGEDMSQYMQRFADTFLSGKIRFDSDVVNVRKSDADDSWDVTILDPNTGNKTVENFAKIVLCSGGASEPHIPLKLDANFSGALIHSNQVGSRLEDLMATTGRIIIIGGGKSAQDVSSYLARQGKQVSVVFDKVDAFFALPIPLPRCIRKSRFMGIISPAMELNSRLERFLHCTRLGSAIVHGMWRFFAWSSFAAFRIPADSPLRNTLHNFWGVRFNDEGVGRSDDFFQLVNQGKIDLIAPARVKSCQGNEVILQDGRSLDAGAVVLCTGYTSSWSKIVDKETREYIGLEREKSTRRSVDEWRHYIILEDPPIVDSVEDQLFSSIYRGIVPSESILRKNFAVNGAVLTTNNGYVFETTGHWISSYFREDPFLQLPASVEEAKEESGRASAWMRKRYPGTIVNESYSAGLVGWGWPQYCDRIMKDMGLRDMRSGGNWFTWPFTTVDSKEMEGLARERSMARMLAHAV